MKSKKEKRLDIAVNTFILVGMLVAVVITNLMRLRGGDARMLVSYIASFGALMGVVNAVLSANGSIWTYIFGIVDVGITAFVAYDNDAWGNYGLHLFFFLPMQFAGFFLWLKRLHSKEDGKGRQRVISRWLPAKGWTFTALSFIVLSTLLFFVLRRVDRTPAIAGLDASIFALNIIGQILMSLAYTDQWFIWIAVDIASVAMWALTSASSASSAYAVVYVAKYFFYTLNAINGLRVWMKLGEVPAKISEGPEKP